MLTCVIGWMMLAEVENEIQSSCGYHRLRMDQESCIYIEVDEMRKTTFWTVGPSSSLCRAEEIK